MAITTVPILELNPKYSAWTVSLSRVEYSEPTDEPIIVLRVGRTEGTFTLDEARALGTALVAAATEEVEPPVIEWKQGRKIRHKNGIGSVWTCLLGPGPQQKTAVNDAGVVYEWGPGLGLFRADVWEIVK